MRKSMTGDSFGLVSPPPLPVSADAPTEGKRLKRQATLDGFKHFKHVHRQKNFASVAPVPKDEGFNNDDVLRKLDHLTREVHVTQKLICSKLDKMDQFLHMKQVDLKPAESKPLAPVIPVVPESDQRFDKVRESVMKGRVSLFKGRESIKGRESFKGRESSKPESGFKGRESVSRHSASAGSPQESPGASPRSAQGPEIFPEGEGADNSKDEEGKEGEPISKQDSDGAREKRKSFHARPSITVNTLATDTNTWRTWTSDNQRRSTFLSSKLSAISGRISSHWSALVSSYAVPEAETAFDRDNSIAEMVNQRTTRQSWFAFKAWNFLDNPDSSWGAKLYDTLEPYVLTLASLFSVLQTLPSFWLPGLARTADFCIDAFIMADVLIRYAVSPSRGLAFFKKWLNVVDMLAALPLIVRILLVLQFQGSSDEPLFFCLVAIARLLKMMRRFQKIHLLVGAFELALEAMPVLSYVLAVLTLIFSTAVYIVEKGEEFDTLPRSIYFTLVTITTLGYGDYAPDTTAGQFIVSILTIVSSVYLAMPLGLIGSAFTTVWQDRDRILLMKKTRQAMHTWGFTAEDIPALFAFFDSKGCGSLSIHDFREMIVAMRIGLSDKRVRELFKSFDQNGSGRVNDQEFVREIFPQEFFDVFSVSDTTSSTSPPSSGVPSSGVLRVQESGGQSSRSNAPDTCGSPSSSLPGTPSAEYQSGSFGAGVCGSPRSSIPTHSLSVPMRSPSGRAYSLNAIVPHAVQRKLDSESSEVSGAEAAMAVFHSEPDSQERLE